MNILDTIIAHKRKEVAEKKKQTSIVSLEKSPFFQRKTQSLTKILSTDEKTGIIAEFKRKSPSKGNINIDARPEIVGKTYEEYGASGISVLTDQHFFNGTPEDLTSVREAVQIPILRKEFIVDSFQLIEAKAIGADVILLIAECLDKKEVAELAASARSLGLEVLLEMHSEKQLDKISENISLVGINNRDLTTFQVDIDRSIQLAEQLPKDLVRIAESGINDIKVIQKMKAAGFHGFLMGEHFMKAQEPGEAFRKFAESLAKVSRES